MIAYDLLPEKEEPLANARGSVTLMPRIASNHMPYVLQIHSLRLYLPFSNEKRFTLYWYRLCSSRSPDNRIPA